MRRSAAPSLLQANPKRPKFSTPFSNVPCIAQSRFKDNAEEIAGRFGLVTESSGTESEKENSATWTSVKQNFCKQPALLGSRRFNLQSAASFKRQSLSNAHEDARMPYENIGCDSSKKSPEESYYSVLWCKASSKKHRKWEGDGILVVNAKNVTLKDTEGKQISRSSGYKTAELVSLSTGSTLLIGGRQVEIQRSVGRDEYFSGSCFSTVVSAPLECPEIVDSSLKESGKIFKAPFIAGIAQTPVAPVALVAKHDPNKIGALVMPRPPLQEAEKHGHQVVDVVVDPFISIHLRPHQREGVQFLYECIMGMRGIQGNGAILADEMGLGKTLQCIALIWTLLKQGPHGGVPAVKRVVIVTPGSLVQNWCKEFTKWLGTERIQPFAVSSSNRVNEFTYRPRQPVMVISYEMFLRCIEDIRKVKFDLIICDEAHRLKNSTVKTSSGITSLSISKRILLTGTPIQNDLQEFYCLAEMASPGVLGSLSAFRKVFGEPIALSQQPGASAEEKELGQGRALQLSKVTAQFVLRRTSEINQKYLPPKVESVLFCRPTKLQLELYDRLLRSRLFSMCLASSYNGTQHLLCISALKKLCNDPRHIYKLAEDGRKNGDESIDSDAACLYGNLLPLFPIGFSSESDDVVEYCAKLNVLGRLLQRFDETRCKTVIVSNSTKTLDMVMCYCQNRSYQYLRLDGQTPVQTRQNIVDRFNSKSSDVLIFLLSSKAGGVGLNLTGAANLILYDIDWNPANDIQAMARVWRDGQKKEVRIYRLLLCGTIEEKIFQRQIAKQALSGTVVDSLTLDRTEFSTDDLKDLFRLHNTDTCSTHELLQCSCLQTPDVHKRLADGSCEDQLLPPSTSEKESPRTASIAELKRWKHIARLDEAADVALQSCSGLIQMIFQNKVD